MIPRLRIFAGPNGSGKSTVIRSVTERLGTAHIGVYVNADNIEQEIRKSGRLNLKPFKVRFTIRELREFLKESTLARKQSAQGLRSIRVGKNYITLNKNAIDPYTAATLADLLRHKLLKSKISFSFETVFSHRSKVDLMLEAAQAGYRVYLYFVATEDPSINIERVRERVLLGGHKVPEDKIVERYWRSLGLLSSASSKTYRSYFFDNSGEATLLFAERKPSGKLVRRKYRGGRAPLPTWFTTFYFRKKRN